MNVLFVCTGNTCRSPMAERLGRMHHPEVHWESAGVRPTGDMYPMAKQVLTELGADPEGFVGRNVADLDLSQFDTIVLIGKTARSISPGLLPHAAAHYWEVKDPYEATGTEDQILHAYRTCANELILRIGRLIASGSAD